VNGLFGTGLHAVRLLVFVLAKITFDDFRAARFVGFDITVGAAHDAHETDAAAFFVVLYMARNSVFFQRAGHTGAYAIGKSAVSAEDRDIPSPAVSHNGMPRLVFRIEKVEIIKRSLAAGSVFTVRLHTCNTAILAAVAFFLFDNDSLHLGPLDF
jgi:hypothetical protein